MEPPSARNRRLHLVFGRLNLVRVFWAAIIAKKNELTVRTAGVNLQEAFSDSA